MQRKTYYMVLGVSNTESDEGIRAAYRNLAKKLHPDVAGDQATGSFRELSEAYSVLSDPQRRREYNERLDRGENGGIVSARRSPPGRLVHEPVTSFGNRDRIRPSFHAMHDRSFRNLTGLDFEVLLTPEEASRGCVVPVAVPVFSHCPQCGGSGQDGVFPCGYCRQRGMIETEARLEVPIGPRATSGSVCEIPLRGFGIHDFYLRLHVVEAAPR